MNIPPLVLITDSGFDDEHLTRVAELVCKAVPGTCVQLRDHQRDDAELEPLATRLREITRMHGGMLLLNRRPDLARRVGADGIHGDARGRTPIVSTPAHDDVELQMAKDGGARFALVSPIYATPGKQAPRGVSALVAARSLAGEMGVIALGGIDENNADACFAAGADGVACIRALLAASDPTTIARRIVENAPVVRSRPR